MREASKGGTSDRAIPTFSFYAVTTSKGLAHLGELVAQKEEKMKTVFLRKIIVLCLLTMMSVVCKAQSMVTEISWNVYNQNYTGLLVLYPNNRGTLKIKTFIAGTGWVWVQQDAVLTNQYDIYGNCTSYINCYKPQTTPYVPWAADNFIVYPNGTMYTQDASGTWSTAIVAYVVPSNNWQNKFREYGIQRR